MGKASNPSKTGADWLRQIKDPNAKRRGEASYFLGSLTPRNHGMLADLMDGAKSRDKDTRFWAMTGIGCLKAKAEPATPLLIAALADPVPANRETALDALSAIPSAARRSVPHIAKVLRDDRQYFVRGAAARALGELGRSPATARAAARALLAALADRDESVRSDAAISLKLIAKHAAFAAPAVAKAMENPKLDEVARDDLAIALRAMRRAAAAKR